MCKTVVRSALPFFLLLLLFWHGIPAIVMESGPMLTPREKSPLQAAQRRVEPATLHNEGQ